MWMDLTLTIALLVMQEITFFVVSLAMTSFPVVLVMTLLMAEMAPIPFPVALVMTLF